MTDSYDQLPDKPRPQSLTENQPYWDGLLEHRLLVQCCANCNKLRHYPRPMCEVCYAMGFTWAEIAGRGTVHSWTVTHHPFHHSFKRDIPYVTVTADLEAGIRLQAPLVGSDETALTLGLPVIVDYADVDATLSLPCLRLVT
jgi:uncharacterized OB-fold protein